MRRVQQNVALRASAAVATRAATFAPDQKASVWSIVSKNTTYSTDFLKATLEEYQNLNFEARYAERYDPAEAAEHVLAYICGKSDAVEGKKFRFHRETPDGGLYFSEAAHEEQLLTIKRIEDRIASRTAECQAKRGISIRSYHSDNNVVLYILEFSEFVPCGGDVCGDLEAVATKGFQFTRNFLTKRSSDVSERYGRVLAKLKDSIMPVSEVTFKGDVAVLTAGYSETRGGTYLGELSVIIQSIPGASVVKKFAETFSNGSHVYTFYVKGATAEQLNSAASQIGLLPHRPHNPISDLYRNRVFTAQELMFANALVIFGFYFTPPKVTEDFRQLRTKLAADQASLSRLKNLRNELVQDVMSERYLGEVVTANATLVKEIFRLFAADDKAALEALEAKTLKELEKDGNRHIIKTFFLFPKVVAKTNFFKEEKAAVAFRLDPSFLSGYDWPRVPHGVFLFIGPQWRGFHIRFTDIARGGVRMIISQSRNAYLANKTSLFQENYNLAYTQLLKNKDIPEGGSKGTILVSTRTGAGFSNESRVRFFKQYVDAMLDVILPNQPQVRDNLKQEEIIFLGPDENTAGEFPKIGALHGKGRGYLWWKSFTTGKDPELGGIPHDEYGMTTESVRVMVNGVYEKLGLNQSVLTKLQTGGPDGDLGSNEIFQSGEIYHAMVDGSGVLYDPMGINREELTRLAKARVMVKEFNTQLLSKQGYFVPAKEGINQQLPNGTTVTNGVDFRNNFHFNISTDVFIPCGGRPRSVTLKNVHQFLLGVETTGEEMLSGRLGDLSKSGKLRYKYIVEGANLFISQDARLALEAVGVVLIKDAAANKGGVTSSSFEVLTGLALSDAEHAQLMSARSKHDAPQFYKDIVNDIIAKIRSNARREFDAIWRERVQNPTKPTTVAIDELSRKIVDIRALIYNSDLFEDKVFVRYVFDKYVPKTLMNKVGMDTFLQRVPQNYQKAIFSIFIASDYVYTSGAHANEFDFYQYMHKQHDLAVKANK